MPLPKPFLKCVMTLLLTAGSVQLYAQSLQADSWQQVLEQKKGTVTALWYDIEPFIYTNPEGRLQGVEYEIMESLKPYLKHTYGVDLQINWVNAGSFEGIYNDVKAATQSGIFGWSYYSITPERRREVAFTPPYMPDLNVLVTHIAEPVYATPQELTSGLAAMNGYTMANTTMEADIELLRNNFYKPLAVTRLQDDYDVMQHIAGDRKGFGYVPLSVYIVGLQKGIKVKRQNVLTSRREGFAAVMPIQTDWQPVLQAYFKTDFFRAKAAVIVSKYLGSEVKDLVFGAAVPDSASNGLGLVSLEKEIVTKRLLDTALELQQQRSFRNTVIIAGILLLLLAVVLYGRFRIKQKMSEELARRNLLISKQHEQIDQMNQLLKLKVLQARMNPHFLFNSLNAVQYFIAADDKKASLVYISRFSAFLRKVIRFGDELSISMHDEVELLKEYLWLEQTRFPGQFEYEVELPPDLGHTQILPLLTHGLVEAALYRGVLNLAAGKGGCIKIGVTAMNDRLLVQVNDNGMSREQSGELEKKKGLSADEEDMLARRIRLFNRQSKRKIHFSSSRLVANGDGLLNEARLEIPQPLWEN